MDRTDAQASGIAVALVPAGGPAGNAPFAIPGSRDDDGGAGGHRHDD